MAKLNLSSLLEAFALGAGIPQSVLRTVPAHKVPAIQADVQIKGVTLKAHSQDLDVPLRSHSGEGKHDE